MTVGELRDLLEGVDDDVEVRMAQQPSWPLEYEIKDIIDTKVNGETVIYLVEGSQVGYLNGDVAEKCGW